MEKAYCEIEDGKDCYGKEKAKKFQASGGWHL